MAKRRLDLTRCAGPRVSTTRRWPGPAAPRGHEVVAARSVGRAAGQHAEGCAPLDPRPRRGDRAERAGKIRRSCRCGGRASARTSLPNATTPSSPSRGCRTILRRAANGTSSPTASKRSSTVGGWIAARWDAGSAAIPVSLRYAAPTGRVLMRWDGARQPTIWTVPPPAIDPADARAELARRYLHVFGPTTAESFAEWAGITPAARSRRVRCARGLARRRCARRSAKDGSWPRTRRGSAPPDGQRRQRRGCCRAATRYFLLQGADRELLVADAARRAELWTPRVWPGAVLVAGEVAGTWRRAGSVVTIQPWRRLARAERDAVELEAQSLPLPGESAIVEGG